MLVAEHISNQTQSDIDAICKSTITGWTGLPTNITMCLSVNSPLKQSSESDRELLLLFWKPCSPRLEETHPDVSLFQYQSRLDTNFKGQKAASMLGLPTQPHYEGLRICLCITFRIAMKWTPNQFARTQYVVLLISLTLW